MTILPKKKQTKEKTEVEGVSGEHSHSQLPLSPAPHSHSDGRVGAHSSRRPPSPSRWLPSGSREERLSASHDPGGRYEEGASNHNKRRHRSSPHHNVRKHRSDGVRPGGSSTHSHPHALLPSGHSHTHQQHHTPLPQHQHVHPRTNTLPNEHQLQVPEMDDLEMQSGYNSEDEYRAPDIADEPPINEPENVEELERMFESALKEKRGFHIKKMGDDGACLFRAVADQIYGDQEMHSIARRNCVDYMAKNSDFFKHYVTEDFNTYLNRKRMDHCHGNHIEMQAMCEVFNRPIEVYQYSTDPINIFQGAYNTDNEPIRISYHRNMHYNSVIDPYKATIGVGLGLPGLQPGLAEKNLMTDAMQQSEDFHLEKTMLEDKMRETDWEVTQETIEEQVARESYLQWLRDNEKRAKRQASPRSASATCSSASDAATWWESSASSEPRPSRSPRSRSGMEGTQTSPSSEDPSEKPGSSSELPICNPALEAPKMLPGGPISPEKPSTSGFGMRSPTPEGAVGGAGISFPETTSIMNELPPQVFGLSEWGDEDDIIAQVMAQSQQEYLENLKKHAAPPTTTCNPSLDGGQSPPSSS